MTWNTQHNITIALPALIFSASCSGKQDTFEQDIDYCETSCLEGIEPFKINAVVLTDNTTSNSNIPTTTSVIPASCSSVDTDWPCVHANSLTTYFIDENGDQVCSDPANTNTCVRFDYEKEQI